MRKRSKVHTAKNRDAQLEEFERKDLGNDLRASGVKPIVIRAKQRPTSILLEPKLIKRLKEKGAKRGLGYQTMLKMIVLEHLDDY